MWKAPARARIPPSGRSREKIRYDKEKQPPVCRRALWRDGRRGTRLKRKIFCESFVNNVMVKKQVFY